MWVLLAPRIDLKRALGTCKIKDEVLCIYCILLEYVISYIYILLESVISYISYIYIHIVLYCIIYSNYIIIPVFLFQRSTPCHVQVQQTLNGLKCAWLGLAGGALVGRRIQRAFGPDLARKKVSTAKKLLAEIEEKESTRKQEAISWLGSLWIPMDP